VRHSRFLTLEGGEGAGKSTQAKWLAKTLADRGIAVCRTREPGGAPGAEAIRTLLLGDSVTGWNPLSEALLHSAARREHVTQTIAPALARGEWVICDRFTDSTLAYQGYGLGVPKTYLRDLARMVAGDVIPDLTIILDIPVEVGLARAASRDDGGTRYERMDIGFHQRLREGFLAIAAAEPKRCIVIDATPPPEAVQIALLQAISIRLELGP
jgi:dTMP kinase